MAIPEYYEEAFNLSRVEDRILFDTMKVRADPRFDRGISLFNRLSITRSLRMRYAWVRKSYRKHAYQNLTKDTFSIARLLLNSFNKQDPDKVDKAIVKALEKGD